MPKINACLSPLQPGLTTLCGMLLLVLTLSSSPLATAAQPPTTPSKRPNIVLIVADDMGYGDSSGYWNTDLQTPVMDEIARNGIRFTQFRVNPLCAPTRASLLTGLYSLETGMWRGPGDPTRERARDDRQDSAARRLKADIQLLPQYLKSAGYATGIFGKWHLGEEPGNTPNARGFDEFVGFLGGAHPYFIERRSRILRNTEPFAGTGHTTDLFAGKAIEFIKANRARPFFCYVPFNAVHGPLRNADRAADSAKSEWLSFYEKRGVPQPRRDYNAVMTHADHRVGDILKTLRELGLESNTFVIYISDNGGILEKFPSNNGPLRGGKGTAYEGGIRVPAVMQWPGVIPPGSVTKANAVHFDLFSTILEAARLPVPMTNGAYPVRGVSLMTLLRSGGKDALPDRYLFWDLYGDVGALHGPWKMVGQISNHHGRFDTAVREAQQAKFELYNLDDDIGEKHDVSEKFPEIYRDLKSRHLQWLRAFAQ